MLPLMVEIPVFATAPIVVKIANPEADPRPGTHCACDGNKAPKKKVNRKELIKLNFIFFIIIEIILRGDKYY